MFHRAGMICLPALRSPLLLAGMVQSVPHALDEHVPALLGPLPVASAAGQQGVQLTRMAGGGDAAQALLLSRWVSGAAGLLACSQGASRQRASTACRSFDKLCAASIQACI